MKKPRGAIYIVWGDAAEKPLARSIRSLQSIHPELPFEVFRFPAGPDKWRDLAHKATMMDLSPFEETLYLDADTVVLDRLDFGFDRARRHGLACCICECPWARRYDGLPKDDAVEFNTGVLFFTASAAPVFSRWSALIGAIDSSIRLLRSDGSLFTMSFNDQASFAQAVEEWGRPPYVLPLNWNFRPQFQRTWFGPIKIWHAYDDPPAVLADFAASYRDPAAIIRFHYLQSE